MRDLSVKLTYQDYVALPDDGRRYEIHDGELSVTPAPGISHQEVSRRLFRALDRHVQDPARGAVWFAPVDVILADDTIVQPDIVYVARDNFRRGCPTSQYSRKPAGLDAARTASVTSGYLVDTGFARRALRRRLLLPRLRAGVDWGLS